MKEKEIHEWDNNDGKRAADLRTILYSRKNHKKTEKNNSKHQLVYIDRIMHTNRIIFISTSYDFMTTIKMRLFGKR